MRVPVSTAIKLQAAACAGGAVVCLRRGAAGRRAHAAAQAVRSGADAGGSGDHRPDVEAGAGLAELAYELLDAHRDTAELLDGLPHHPSRAAHLDYLRALQRKGREVLARTAPEELSPCRWNDVEWLDVR